MPLSELPPGHVGRNGLGEAPTGSSHEGNRSIKERNIGAHTGLSKTPSSIQNMLKNTTETGDVGQFSIKPARVPSIIYRTPKSPSTAQSVPTKKRHVAGRYDEQRNGSQLSRHPSSANAPVVATTYRSHNQRSYRGARSGTTGDEEDEKSYSMTQSSITSQSFSHRPYLTGLQFHDQENFRGTRPRSPFAYPTRLKRPGYRPSSPALSDYNSPGLGTYMGPSRAASFRTSSPLSIYTQERVPSAWQQNFNRSDPMLRYHAPLSRHGDYAETLPPSALAPLSQLPNGLTSARSSTPTQFSDVSVSRRPSPSPSPVFYDYTESFQEDHYHSVTMSSSSLAEQVIPEDTLKVYHELDGNAISSHVAELPAHRTLSLELPKSHAQDLPEWPLSTGITRKAVPRSRQLEQHTRYLEGTAARAGDQDPPMDGRDKGLEMENNIAHMDRIESLASGKIPEANLAPFEKPHLDNVPPGQNQGLSASNAPLKSNSLSSSSSESMYSLQSPSRKDRQTPAPDLAETSDTVLPSSACLEIPLIQSKNSRMIDRNIQSHAASVPRGTSIDGKSDTTEHTDIYAPTPERAASSLSNQNRFSRILCLDEDSEDVNKFTAKAAVKAGSHDQKNMENDRAAASSSVNYLLRHENGYLLDASHGGAKVAQLNINGAGPESTVGASYISKDSMKLPATQIPRRSSSRLLLTAMNGNTSEPTIPPRRSSCMRKPAYHLFEQASRPVPGISVVTEDLDRSAAPIQQSMLKSATCRQTMKELPTVTEGLDKSRAPGQVTLLKSANVPRAAKELSLLPRVPTLKAYSPPIDPTPSALPFAFTPLFGHLKAEIPNANVVYSPVPESEQTVGVSSNPAELPVVASPRQSMDVSVTQAEPDTTSSPEQIVDIEVDQRKPTGISLAKQGRDMRADLGEPTNTSRAKQHVDMSAGQPNSGTEAALKLSLVVPATLPEPKRVSSSVISSSRLSESDDEEQAPISKYKLKMRSNRESPPSLQPWNLDASYPWTGQSPKLEVTMPRKSEDPPEQCSSVTPRFKLKVHQSSSFTAGTTKITKLRRSMESPVQANINVSNDLFRASAFGRQPRPSQENSSQSPHLQTRFKESFEQPSATFAISPTITLVPPSPGLNLEARSFFSDDSSQTRNKGSLRKRLSQLRAMASRNTMSEEGRSFDRGILRSRASGRISKQSTRAAEGVLHSKSVRLKVTEKVKEWLLRGGERVRELWRGRSVSQRPDLDRGV